MKSRVSDVVFREVGGMCTVLLYARRRLSAHLVVGAGGINSAMRECLVGHPGKPAPTGDLVYWLLLNTKDMITDPKLREFVTDPQLDYLGLAGCACWYFPFSFFNLNDKC